MHMQFGQDSVGTACSVLYGVGHGGGRLGTPDGWVLELSEGWFTHSPVFGGGGRGRKPGVN